MVAVSVHINTVTHIITCVSRGWQHKVVNAPSYIRLESFHDIMLYLFIYYYQRTQQKIVNNLSVFFNRITFVMLYLLLYSNLLARKESWQIVSVRSEQVYATSLYVGLHMLQMNLLQKIALNTLENIMQDQKPLSSLLV